jgi:hypothetical protein
MDDKLKLIQGVSSDADLLTLADHLGIHIDDVLLLGEINSPINIKKTYLILLNDSSKIGHWVCSDKGFYFDSMGIGAPSKLGLKKYNKIQYQGTYNNYCGIWCLLWIYCRQHNKMQLMKQFQDMNNKDFE